MSRSYGCSAILLVTKQSRNAEPLRFASREGSLGHLVLTERAMINWPEMLRYAEDWADGFLTGAATVSLIGVAGVAFVLLVHTI